MLTLQGMMTHTKSERHEPRLNSLSQLEGDVLVVGGTLDPIQSGHVELGLAAAADKRVRAKTVLYMPNGQNPLKANRPKASDEQRLAMIELALMGHSNLFVSDFEIQAQGKQFTVDTLSSIRAQAPKLGRLIFAMGADQIPRLHEWRNFEKLFELAHIVIVKRGGEVVDSEKLPQKIRDHIKANTIEFNNPHSSTEVREALGKGDLETAHAALSPAVFEYIVKHRLYR